MQNIAMFTMGARKCKINCMTRYFQALVCFYIRIFQTSINQGVQNY